MIVVLIHRPEEMDGPHQSSAQDDYDPFNGVEIYGIYMDAEYKAVMDMVNDLADANPKWHIHVSPNEKMKVGFNTATANIPKPAGGKL
jgi:hypothetical protein